MLFGRQAAAGAERTGKTDAGSGHAYGGRGRSAQEEEMFGGLLRCRSAGRGRPVCTPVRETDVLPHK